MGQEGREGGGGGSGELCRDDVVKKKKGSVRGSETVIG